LVGAGRVLIISVAKYTFSQVPSNEELLEDPNVALKFGLRNWLKISEVALKVWLGS
jgi:hypothetical protein